MNWCPIKATLISFFDITLDLVIHIFPEKYTLFCGSFYKLSNFLFWIRESFNKTRKHAFPGFNHTSMNRSNFTANQTTVFRALPTVYAGALFQYAILSFL